MDNIIITRHKDKCALCKKLVMIDSTEAIYGIHVGVLEYKQRASQAAKQIRDWNILVQKRTRIPIGKTTESAYVLNSTTSGNSCLNVNNTLQRFLETVAYAFVFFQ